MLKLHDSPKPTPPPSMDNTGREGLRRSNCTDPYWQQANRQLTKAMVEFNERSTKNTSPEI